MQRGKPCGRRPHALPSCWSATQTLRPLSGLSAPSESTGARFWIPGFVRRVTRIPRIAESACPLDEARLPVPM